MKTVALLLVIAASASAHEWSDLLVKWSPEGRDPSRNDSFFEIPRTRSEAESAGWMEVTGVNSLSVTVHCYPNDGQFCIALDSYGHIAGFQIGVLVSDVAYLQSIYNMSRFPSYRVKTIFGEEYWTTTAYTVSPDIIEAGGRKEWKNLTGSEGIWIETTDGYLAIPRYVKDLDPIWIQEACFERMGTHYYYNMHNTTACKDFQPWFLLYHDGELNSAGIEGFGLCTSKSRSWCELVDSSTIKPGIPTGPDCLTEWAIEYGFLSMHVYFTPEPWNISCS